MRPRITEPMSAARCARRLGLSEIYLERLCRRGRVQGAKRHPLTRKWWVYPPVTLLIG